MMNNGIAGLCDNHPLISAIAICDVCGKPVCGDCAVTKRGKYFCNDSSHQAVFNSYAFFCESPTMFEIELVAKNLEENGVPVQWFDRRQYHTQNLPVLYVQNGSTEKAFAILQSLDLLDFIIVKNGGR